MPIGAVTLALAVNRMVNKARPRPQRGSTCAGLVTFSGSLFLLVFALVIGNDDGWSSVKVLAMLFGAAVLMAAFIVAELHRNARCSTCRSSASLRSPACRSPR